MRPRRRCLRLVSFLFCFWGAIWMDLKIFSDKSKKKNVWSLRKEHIFFGRLAKKHKLQQKYWVSTFCFSDVTFFLSHNVFFFFFFFFTRKTGDFDHQVIFTTEPLWAAIFAIWLINEPFSSVDAVGGSPSFFVQLVDVISFS